MKRFLALSAAAMLAALPAMAQKRAAVGNDITIEKGDTATEVSCVMCSVYVHGTVDGKIAVVNGNLIVDGTVDGQTAIVKGTLHVLDGGVVNGNVAIKEGQYIKDPGAKVTAQVAQTGGHLLGTLAGIGIVIVLIPLLLLAGIIWLIVWLVRRNRTPVYPPYPPPPPAPGNYPPPVR